jgi:hypothetical protein
MTPAEQLAARFEERAADERALAEKLAAAQARAQVALANRATEKAAFAALEADATRGLRENERMATSQWVWLYGDQREPLRLAECQCGRELALVKALSEQLAEIRRDLAQQDRQIMAGKVVELSRPAVAPRRRTPAPVDYNDVVPRGAAS